MLQWGRDFNVAERVYKGGTEMKIEKLQWGRDFNVAERNTE